MGLDPNFGKGGKVLIDVGGSCAYDLFIQKDGKILVTGPSEAGIALARCNPDGTLDKNFGKEGKAIIPIEKRLSPWPLTGGGSRMTKFSFAIGFQSEGKILVAGTSYNGSEWDFITVRVNEDGSLDKSFGSEGFVITDIYYDDHAKAITIQPDGKIVVGGTSFDGGMWNFAIVRYNPDGSLDKSFGEDGIVTTKEGVGNVLGIQQDGKIVIGGGYGGNFLLARYNQDGSIDTSFGINEKTSVPLEMGDGFISDMEVLQDGRIIAVGPSGAHLALMKYKSNGMLDRSFGTGGKVMTYIGTSEVPYSFGIQKDGKIVVAGYFFKRREGGFNGEIIEDTDIILLRYNPDGTTDTGFYEDGEVRTDVTGGSDDAAMSLEIQQDGKIVVGGCASSNFAILRYLP